MKPTTDREDWLNEHGEPNFEYLRSLARNNGPEALEKLKSIAEDLNVECRENDSVETLVEKIRLAADANEEVDPITTS